MSGVARMIESALAERDAQIDELQQAVLELAAAAESATMPSMTDADMQTVVILQGQLAAMSEHVAKLENRLDEQERTMRHTLTMLIEWIESGEGQRVAA